MTWLYKHSQDVVGEPHRVSAQLAVGWSDKLVAATITGTIKVFSNGAWSDGNGGAALSSADVNSMFVDSRGYVFVTLASGGKLWRSTDDGVTWSAVYTYSVSTDYAFAFAEDDLGNLYANGYPSAPLLLKSTDGGATWTDIVGNLAVVPHDHVHMPVWDPYRKLLYVTHGDDGALSKIQVSDDHGATFSSWTASAQATAIVPTADAIYYAADSSGDRKIYKVVLASTATLADVIASTPSAVMDPTVTFGVAAQADAGFARMSGESGGGVFFCYGKDGCTEANLAVFDGTSWSSKASVVGTDYQWSHRFAKVSYYNSGDDGYFYGVHTPDNELYKWRLYPDSTVFRVADSGTDYTADGVDTPWASYQDYQPLDDSSSVRFESVQTSPILVKEITAIDFNGMEMQGEDLTAPLVSEDFEGAGGTFTEQISTGVVIDQASALKAHAGTQSAKLDLTGGSGNAYAYMKQMGALSGLVSGDVVDVEGWFYYDKATKPANNTHILRLGPGGADIHLYVGSDGYLSFQANTNTYKQHPDDAVAFPLQTWTHLKLRFTYHATQGSVTVWQDDAVLMHVVGIPVTGAMTDVRWIFNSNDLQVAYWDDVKVAINSDSSQPPAVKLASTSGTFTRLNQSTKKAVLSGAGNIVAYSEFQTAAGKLECDADATAAKLYNSTLYSGTGSDVVLDNAGVLDVQNCILDTVTVTNTGALTHTNNGLNAVTGITAGGTEWTADPTWVDAANDLFMPRPENGHYQDGVALSVHPTTDFYGKASPQGTLPTRGAVEPIYYVKGERAPVDLIDPVYPGTLFLFPLRVR